MTTNLTHLPNELLLLIIQFTANTVTLPPSFSDSTNIWALTHVFSRLRKLAISTPTLWQLVVANTGTSLLIPPAAIKSLRDRSGHKRIHLHLLWYPSMHTSAYTTGGLESLARHSNTHGQDPDVSLSLIRSFLLSLCHPFSGRVEQFSMTFADMRTYQVVKDGLYILPSKFFTTITNFTLVFEEGAQVGLPEDFPFDLDPRFFAKAKISVSTAADPSAVLGFAIPKSEIKHLHISNANKRFDAVYLSMTSTVLSTLTHLSLTGHGLRQSPEMVCSILASGRNLRSLEVGIDWVHNLRLDQRWRLEVLGMPALAECPELRSLDVSVYAPNSASVCLGTCLGSVVAPSLTRLRIRLPTQDHRPGTFNRRQGSLKDIDTNVPFRTFLSKCAGMRVLDLRRSGVIGCVGNMRIVLPGVRILQQRKRQSMGNN